MMKLSANPADSSIASQRRPISMVLLTYFAMKWVMRSRRRSSSGLMLSAPASLPASCHTQCLGFPNPNRFSNPDGRKMLATTGKGHNNPSGCSRFANAQCPRHSLLVRGRTWPRVSACGHSPFPFLNQVVLVERVSNSRFSYRVLAPWLSRSTCSMIRLPPFRRA